MRGSSLKIEVETLDTPQRDFAEVRHELIGQGRKFDETTLQVIPYYQLYLCCIGSAGSAACSPQLVQREKTARRERFLNMEPDEFKEAETYLKIEQMYDDVMHTIANRFAPKWDDLNTCQKLWAKLTCLYNHVDNPSQRIQEVLTLFLQCAKNPHGKLPMDVCNIYAGKLKGLASAYPGKVSDEGFREKIGEMAETVLEFMLPEERKLLEKEQLQGFSCTSDCFRFFV